MLGLGDRAGGRKSGGVGGGGGGGARALGEGFVTHICMNKTNGNDASEGYITS